MAVIQRLISLSILMLLFSTSAAVVRVSPEEAAKHLIKKVDPVYTEPSTRLQDTVFLTVVIDSGGLVSSARIVSGLPLLLPAAIEAVKQWQYRPFLVDGKAVEVTTTVSVPFSLGISNADYKREKETAQLYYKQDKECRNAISSGHYSDAQKVCGEEVKTAEQLPAARELERVDAYGLLGQAFFYDKKFPEALVYFRYEVESAKKRLNDDDAEMAYAYRHLAWGLHTNNRSDEALTYYERAEASLQAAQKKIESEFLKNEYAKKLKATMTEHAALLRQLGRISDAQAIERTAQSIVIKTGLNPY